MDDESTVLKVSGWISKYFIGFLAVAVLFE